MANSDSTLQTIHGGLLLGLLLLPLFLPELAAWPWYFLVPLSAYAMIVCPVAPLRRSVHWIRLGRFRGWVIVATAALITLSSSVLLLYDMLFEPDLTPLSRLLPLSLPLHVAVIGTVFSTVNARMEEVFFRGVLLDALTSQVGTTCAVIAQGFAFGVGHAHGYPPGMVGMVLAGGYGIVLGALRLWAGGLFAPWVAHVFADATIFWIVVSR